MPFFMKKMRRNLISKKQIGKYLLYAIGETIVVTIGVYLAFQLNMNARHAADKRTEITYLQGIVVDLDQDIYELTNLLQFDTAQLSAFTTIQQAFSSEPLKKDPALPGSIGTANIFTNFNGNSTFFEDMKSSGKITLISSDTLRLSILKYQNHSRAETKHQVEQLRRRHATLASDAFETNIDLNSILESSFFMGEWQAEIDPLDLSFFEKDIKSEEVKVFANRLSLMKGLVKFRNLGNEALLSEAKALRSETEDYLASKGVKIQNGIQRDS
ncbi:MAG: DUF6090 family protein [Hellea sp.]